MVIAESIRSAIERRNQRREEEARRREEEARQEARHEGLQEGLQEGLREAHRSWMDWNRRRVLAEKQGKTFDDPPPDIPAG